MGPKAESATRSTGSAGRIGERRDWLPHCERPVAVVVTRTRPEEGEVEVSALARRELFWAEKSLRDIFRRWRARWTGSASGPRALRRRMPTTMMMILDDDLAGTLHRKPPTRKFGGGRFEAWTITTGGAMRMKTATVRTVIGPGGTAEANSRPRRRTPTMHVDSRTASPRERARGPTGKRRRRSGKPPVRLSGRSRR